MRYGLPFRSLVLGTLVLVVACGEDAAVAPEIWGDHIQTAAAEPREAEAALTAQDLLDDPLFRALMGGIDDARIAVPLRSGLDRVIRGQLARGRHQLAGAGAAAEALAEEPQADFETLLAWSAIALFLDRLDPRFGARDQASPDDFSARSLP